MKTVVVLTLLISLVVAMTIPDSYVLTPFGYRHTSCVHGVTSGSTIIENKEGFVVNDGAKEYTIAKCTAPGTYGALPSGWAVYEMYQTTQGVTGYNGTWVTPGAPKDQQLQTLFTFTGLQNAFLTGPTDSISIIQPVLQWGPSAA